MSYDEVLNLSKKQFRSIIFLTITIVIPLIATAVFFYMHFLVETYFYAVYALPVLGYLNYSIITNKFYGQLFAYAMNHKII